MASFELTKEEVKAIKAIKKAAKIWPESLWLFSGDGTLHVMRCDEDGEHIHINSGGIDSDYCITTVDIDNDGGGW